MLVQPRLSSHWQWGCSARFVPEQSHWEGWEQPPLPLLLIFPHLPFLLVPPRPHHHLLLLLLAMELPSANTAVFCPSQAKKQLWPRGQM